MLGAVHHSFGNPSMVLKIEDCALPEPGAGQVRVKTILSAIHNHDLLTVAGRYGYKPPLPAIGGSEAVGVIDALGDGVSGLAVGQRVSVSGVHGAWAEYFIASATSAVPVPDGIDDGTAAQLISMPLSALCVLKFTDARPGQWVVQNAANGAVAKVLAMVAKSRGINVINLVRRPEAVAELAGLGIANIVSTSDADWRAKVEAIVGGNAIASAIDGVGGEASGELLSLVGENGLLVSFGAMSGKPMQISAGDLIFKQAVVKGFWLSRMLQTTPPQEIGAMIGELLRLVEAGVVRLQVGGVFDLAQIAEAAKAATAAGRPGKILLRP